MAKDPIEKIQQQVGIVGRSQAIRDLVRQIVSIAPTDLSVLITGESGTGKEVVAKAIHELSPRRNKPMISVNCGAIPEGILESELFGHEKGAFTGAVASKKGYFELADGGTIFLDEIGEMPLQTQVKLLRVLENGEFMRVGSGEVRRVDVRVIAATNRDLAIMVQQGQFRQDLYFRLKAASIFIPPLRERREDIPLLIDHFVQQVLHRNNIEFAGFTEEAMQLLLTYDWPGNVRELRNVIETVIILAGGKKITVDLIREHLMHYEEHVEVSDNLPILAGTTVDRAERELIYKALVSLGVEMREMKQILLEIERKIENGNPVGIPMPPPVAVTRPEDIEIKPLDELEREMIEKALEKFRGNRRKAARALNISERTLYRKIKEYGLV